MELIDGHQLDNVERSIRWKMLYRVITVSAIPATRSVVTSCVTLPIGVVLATVSIILWSALGLGPLIFTVSPIKQTSFGVAGFVTFSIFEHISTGKSVGGGVASLPRIDSKIAVSIVKHAGELVTLWITSSVSSLLLTPVKFAHPELIFVINHQISSRMSRSWCHIDAPRRRNIKDITVLSLPLSFTVAIVVSGLVDTSAVVSAGIVHALVPVVHLTVVPGRAEDTLAPVPAGVRHAGPAVVAVVHQTHAVLSVVTPGTGESSPTLAVVAGTISLHMTLTSI